MKTIPSLSNWVLAVVLSLFASVASSASFSNTASSGIYPFGSPDTTNYGQTFAIGSESTLEDWSFFALSGNSGNLRLVVANWDGTKPVGSELYSSADLTYSGGSQELAFTGINLNLAAGTYISFITVYNVSSPPASDMTLSGSDGDGGLGGYFAFYNSTGGDPFAQVWDCAGCWSPANLQFSANISAPVPEPEIYAMMGLGLGLLGFMRRKKNTSA